MFTTTSFGRVIWWLKLRQNILREISGWRSWEFDPCVERNTSITRTHPWSLTSRQTWGCTLVNTSWEIGDVWPQLIITKDSRDCDLIGSRLPDILHNCNQNDISKCGEFLQFQHNLSWILNEICSRRIPWKP